MAKTARPVVLIVVGHYLPGFKAGGILRSVESMVDHLHSEFRFLVITRDRDLGDERPYPGIINGQWQKVGNASAYYLSPEGQSLTRLRELVRQTPHDMIYLNSFFDPLTVKVLLSRRLGILGNPPVLVAPRGEFAWPSLRQKYPKKVVFMQLARLTRLYGAVTWHASSTTEADDITQAMKIERGAIQVALDLPAVAAERAGGQVPDDMPTDCLRVVFLSRISPEKNLDYALRVLKRIEKKVLFDIIGPLENRAYWRECEKVLPELPAHVVVRTLGGIAPSAVMRALEQYDLLFLPSGGENYGHAIVEAITVGTPALISTKTPWRGLKEIGVGWDLPLDDPDAFVRVIDELASSSLEERRRQRKVVRANAEQLLAKPALVDGNRQLLNLVIAHPAAQT